MFLAKTSIVPPQQVTAFVGKHNLSITDEVGAEKKKVWQIILHPDWNAKDHRFDADISIVVLLDRVKFNSFVEPVCLPPSSQNQFDGEGTVVGWGPNLNFRQPGKIL